MVQITAMVHEKRFVLDTAIATLIPHLCHRPLLTQIQEERGGEVLISTYNDDSRW
jgi:predicted transcriptional regulator